MKKIALILCAIAYCMPAYASPGAVDKKGCHSKPRHCHASSELRTMKNGRHYVPFGNGN